MIFSNWLYWYLGSVALTLIAMLGTVMYEEWLVVSRNEPPLYTSQEKDENYCVAVVMSTIPFVNVLVLVATVCYFYGSHVRGFWSKGRGNPND